jgi:hypothetical protein
MLPESDRLTDIVRIVRRDGATRRSRGVGALIVKNDPHIEMGRLCHNIADQPKKGVGEIADTPREANPCMRDHSTTSGLSEDSQLAQ